MIFVSSCSVIVHDTQYLSYNTILFTRLIAIVQREDDMRGYFEYELTTIPTSLFKDNAMRKTAKAQLANALTKNVSEQHSDGVIHAKYVIYGGALIHRLKWAKKTYKNIAIQYVRYVSGKYGGGCCIAFDGYEQGPSIKNHEYRRRHTKSCANVQVKEYLEAYQQPTKFPFK